LLILHHCLIHPFNGSKQNNSQCRDAIRGFGSGPGNKLKKSLSSAIDMEPNKTSVGLCSLYIFTNAMERRSSRADYFLRPIFFYLSIRSTRFNIFTIQSLPGRLRYLLFWEWYIHGLYSHLSYEYFFWQSVLLSPAEIFPSDDT